MSFLIHILIICDVPTCEEDSFLASCSLLLYSFLLLYCCYY